MRRFLILFALIMLACQALAPQAGSPSPSPSPSASPAPALTSSPTPLHLPLPSETIVPTPEPEVTYTSRFHPDGDLYVSDVISMEIIAPAEQEAEGRQVQARVIEPVSEDLGAADFRPYGIAGRYQATMQWVWDTSQLEPGAYTLEFTVNQDGPSWTETVTLHPQSQIPPPEPEAHWEDAEIECCILYYITGTQSERDLPELLEITEEQAEAAAQNIKTEFDRPVPITLLPRVLGHGGFAGEEIYVSYLDRNYAGSNFGLVVHHEMIHILDNRLGGELRPSILVEGLAVYLSGGHFKTEPVFSRAAALLDLGWFIPLSTLTDNFYTSQHEIGYIEAGALVHYLVRSYGWEAFSDFYRDIHPVDDGSQSDAIDRALQDHFDLTLSQLDSRFRVALKRQQVIPDLRDDVRLTVAFYNTVRRYQQLLDPSAYFLTAWLPGGEQMRERDIVADYLRHPTSVENVVLEKMLVEADEHLRAGRYSEAEMLISEVNVALGELDDPAVDPVVAN
jgi:hypothetical protein